MNRILHANGRGDFQEGTYDRPATGSTDIAVRSVMTGVCRSDIDMMTGAFPCLPLHMQGHEGLGTVVHIGEQVMDVKVGDIVATRGEPAYADFYNVKKNEYVKVPEVHPRFILEPVACGINIVRQARPLIDAKGGTGKRLLLLGSGFLAWVAYHYLRRAGLDSRYEITVCGGSNRQIWGKELAPHYYGTFDVVIDLSDKTDVFDRPILNNEALIIFGSQKTITTDFSNLLWKACTMVFPSPRTDQFYDCLLVAKTMIVGGQLNVDPFWTQGYDRDTEWRQAFEDGVNRPRGYSRGYITWK
jgi:D-arabinose 1-dehydrogenase-like Zn-dependent alcohol dehydrogenase